MAPQATPLYSPSELAYLQSSLILDPPIRPDGRSSTTFRPLSAETDILPSTNGSARLCFADGTEAIVGVKSEVQKSSQASFVSSRPNDGADEMDTGGEGKAKQQKPYPATISAEEQHWVEISIDIPGQRDDDHTVVFLGQMILEGLLADGSLGKKLWINDNWHWKLYIDVRVLLSLCCSLHPIKQASTFLPVN